MSIRKMKVTVEGKAYDVTVEMLDEAPAAPTRAAPAAAVAAPAPAPVKQAAPAPAPAAAAGGGSVVSPLAGKIVSVDVKVGDQVEAGQTVLILEAMKMNTEVTAASAGSVTAVNAAAGDVVAEGAVLVEIG